MSGFARKDEVVAFKITEMDSIATTTAGCTATRAYCVPQELTHAVIARLWHEAFDDAKTELSRPGAQHLDLSCRATFACDDGACDDVRPGSKYVCLLRLPPATHITSHIALTVALSPLSVTTPSALITSSPRGLPNQIIIRPQDK